MKVYKIQFKNSALKELRKLPKPTADQISHEIDRLSVTPRPHQCKKLNGAEDLFRIRVGNYRIIYQVQDGLLLVLIIRIGDRKEVYRELRGS